MAQPLDLLRRADQPPVQRRTASPPPRAPRGCRRPGIGSGTDRASPLRPLLQHHGDHLRDHVAGALDRSRCRRRACRCRRGSLAVLAMPLISSSLCSEAFCTTTPPTVTGSSLATGVSAPVRPTWISMRADGGRPLGREFVRNRPARAARHEAEPLLPVEPVHLVHDAVDVVVELGALDSISR